MDNLFTISSTRNDLGLLAFPKIVLPIWLL